MLLVVICSYWRGAGRVVGGRGIERLKLRKLATEDWGLLDLFWGIGRVSTTIAEFLEPFYGLS